MILKNINRICRSSGRIWNVLRYSTQTSESVPKISSEDDTSSSLSSFIFDNLDKTCSLPALVNREEQLTFMETWGSAVNFGGALLVHGIQPGSVLATLSPNTAELVVATLGATEVGVAVAPLCPTSIPETLCRQLVASQASAVLTSSDNLDTVVTAAKYYGKLKLVIVVNTGEEEGEREVMDAVSYVDLISSPVSSWPSEAELRPHYKQSPALLCWRGDRQGDFLAFSHQNMISGVTELHRYWAAWGADSGAQLTSLVTVPAVQPSSLTAILYHLLRGHRVIIDRKCPTLPLTIQHYRPSIYHLGTGAATWIVESKAVSLSSVEQLILHSQTEPVPGLRDKVGRTTILSHLTTNLQLSAGSHLTSCTGERVELKLGGDQRTMGVWDRGHLQPLDFPECS